MDVDHVMYTWYVTVITKITVIGGREVMRVQVSFRIKCSKGQGHRKSIISSVHIILVQKNEEYGKPSEVMNIITKLQQQKEIDVSPTSPWQPEYPLQQLPNFCL